MMSQLTRSLRRVLRISGPRAQAIIIGEKNESLMAWP
jgi:hypothetical protein